MINKKLIIFIILIAFVNLNFSINIAQINLNLNPIVDNGILLGFFNGVKNTRWQANESKRWLREIHGNTNNLGESIEYQLFYNTSQGLFLDLVETFEQRMKEHAEILSDRFELFFETLIGGGTWWQNIIKSIPKFGKVLTGLVATVVSTTISFLTKFISFFSGKKSKKKANYQEHKKTINHYINQNKKFVFVAHSQGNLFVNEAFKYIKSKYAYQSTNSAKVVHIAPASVKTNGKHVLADKDLIINGLRTTGFVPKITDDIPYPKNRLAGLNNKTDFKGHGFLEIYLNNYLNISNSVNDKIKVSLNNLENPRIFNSDSGNNKGFYDCCEDYECLSCCLYWHPNDAYSGCNDYCNCEECYEKGYIFD